MDAGTTQDAGPSEDAGSTGDAGSTEDAGPSEDAGSTEDAGSMEDAGSTDDAGTDGGPMDAGGSDAGPGTDAGPPGDELSFVFRFDPRRCAAPRCGGWWMRAVNQSSTTCFDGSTADECYVAEIDWSGAGYDAAAVSLAESAVGGTIVDGRITTEVISGVTIGGFEARAAWIAEWGTPPTSDGRATAYHSLSDNGLRCLVDPCFNIDLVELNTGTTSTGSSLNLTSTGASDGQQMSGLRALSDGTLRAVGLLRDDDAPGPGGLGRTYIASQFYVRL